MTTVGSSVDDVLVINVEDCDCVEEDGGGDDDNEALQYNAKLITRMLNTDAYEENDDRIVVRIAEKMKIDRILAEESWVYSLPETLLIKKPTVRGRKLLDELKALKLTAAQSSTRPRRRGEGSPKILLSFSVSESANHYRARRVYETLVIPNDVVVSAQFSECVWGAPLTTYVHKKFPDQDLFERAVTCRGKSLVEPDSYAGKVLAFFAAQYVKPAIRDPLERALTASNNLKSWDVCRRDGGRSGLVRESTLTASGDRFYFDFSLVLVRDGRILDYAIHGIHNNIIDLLDRYDVTALIVHEGHTAGLQAFLSAPSQPFVTLKHRVAETINYSGRTSSSRTPVMSSCCERRNTNCSFCKALGCLYDFHVQQKKDADFDPVKVFLRRRRDERVDRRRRRGLLNSGHIGPKTFTPTRSRSFRSATKRV